MKNSYYDIIYGPCISEKSTNVADKYRQIVFKVKTDVNKIQVRNAVEKIFSVKVAKVNVMNQRGKARTFKQIKGKKSNWKKAYVTLCEGYDIKFTDVV